MQMRSRDPLQLKKAVNYGGRTCTFSCVINFFSFARKGLILGLIKGITHIGGLGTSQ